MISPASPVHPPAWEPPVRTGCCAGYSDGRSSAPHRTTLPAQPGHWSPAPQWQDRCSRSRHTDPAPGILPVYEHIQWPVPPGPPYPDGESAHPGKCPGASRKIPILRSDTPRAHRPDGGPPNSGPGPPAPARHTVPHPGSALPGSSRCQSTPAPGLPAWRLQFRPGGAAGEYPNTNCYM